MSAAFQLEAGLSPGVGSWLTSPVSEHTLRLELARRAQREWAEVPRRSRAERLGRVADQLVARQAEMAGLLGTELGTRGAALEEIAAAAITTRRLCGKPETVPAGGSQLAWLPHRRRRRLRVPWGVALVLTGRELSLRTSLSLAISSLLAGNAVVVKPSEHAPVASELVGRLLHGCDLPINLCSVVAGSGETGAELVAAVPDIIFCSASPDTGRKVMVEAAVGPIPIHLGLRTTHTAIVLADADLEFASSAVVWGLFGAGRSGSSRGAVLVDASVVDVLVPLITRKIAALDPVSDRTSDAGTAWEFQAFRDRDEAVHAHNRLGAARTASVFGSDLGFARTVAARLDAVSVAINEVPGGQGAAPGGFDPTAFARDRLVDSPRWGGRLAKRPWWFPYGRVQAELRTALTEASSSGDVQTRLRALIRLGPKALQLLSSRSRL